jgi:hypothetical protein
VKLGHPLGVEDAGPIPAKWFPFGVGIDCHKEMVWACVLQPDYATSVGKGTRRRGKNEFSCCKVEPPSVYRSLIPQTFCRTVPVRPIEIGTDPRKPNVFSNQGRIEGPPDHSSQVSQRRFGGKAGKRVNLSPFPGRVYRPFQLSQTFLGIWESSPHHGQTDSLASICERFTDRHFSGRGKGFIAARAPRWECQTG